MKSGGRNTEAQCEACYGIEEQIEVKCNEVALFGDTRMSKRAIVNKFHFPSTLKDLNDTFKRRESEKRATKEPPPHIALTGFVRFR